MHNLLLIASAGLFVFGSCCAFLAGHSVQEARTYRSCFWPFMRDAIANGLAGALCIGLALAAYCYA